MDTIGMLLRHPGTRRMGMVRGSPSFSAPADDSEEEECAEFSPLIPRGGEKALRRNRALTLNFLRGSDRLLYMALKGLGGYV